jgi:hypothetical protein
MAIGGNKIVLLDKSGEFMFLNKHLGVEFGGIWFSNDSFEGRYGIRYFPCRNRSINKKSRGSAEEFFVPQGNLLYSVSPTLRVFDPKGNNREQRTKFLLRILGIFPSSILVSHIEISRTKFNLAKRKQQNSQSNIFSLLSAHCYLFSVRQFRPYGCFYK